MIDNITGAPSLDEAVSIGGVTYTLKCGTSAAYQISVMGVEPADIFLMPDRDRRITSFAHILKLFRACIAHNFIVRKESIPTTEELAMMLEGSPPELLQEISEKTLKTVFPKLMALTQTVRLQESAPAAEPKLN
jgi:hypothetical protein